VFTTRIGSAVFLCLTNYLKHIIDHVRVITAVTQYRNPNFFPWLPYRVITHYPFSISISDYPVMGNVHLRHDNKSLGKNTGKERPWLMFSGIRTNPRDVKIDQSMTENVNKSLITRDTISLIFYEVAPTIGVVLADMIDGTKVVPNFLAGPITTKRISHLKEVRKKLSKSLIVNLM
jgi:mRNA-degrading endonuclease toxin of MazEF toxin-antitoxin module